MMSTRDATTGEASTSVAMPDTSSNGATQASDESTAEDPGTPSAANPSPGCGKAGRPGNGTVTVENAHIYSFPASYDGSKPFPLLMAFHACGNPIDQFLGLTRGSAFETDYVRAMGRSTDSGGCWDYNKDIAKVLAIYDELMENYCIDMDRVFATGHSSGAQMVVQIMTHKADAEHLNFKAVAPVAASDYGAHQVAVPVMYIQGTKDSVRGNDGGAAVARFRTGNMCEMTSTPYTEVMGCQSGGTNVDPGCIQYDGCSVPTIWCSHNDPEYSNTSHGVPCFAVKAMYDFFTDMP